MDSNIQRQTLSAKEAAQYLGVSYGLILELAKRKEIPCVRAGRRVLFRTTTLNQWMQQKEAAEAVGSSTQQYGVLRRIEE